MPFYSFLRWTRIRIRLQQALRSSLGGLITIGAIGCLSSLTGTSFLIPSFGASCFIAFVIPDSAFARPRNIIGGHVLSSLIGIGCFLVFGHAWWGYAFAVSLAIGAMQAARVLHPPAAANPLLIMTQGGAPWSFVISPVLSGSILLVVIATLYNQLLNQPRHHGLRKNFLFALLQPTENNQPKAKSSASRDY